MANSSNVSRSSNSAVDISTEPHHIAGMFDAIAPRYDLLNRLLSAGLDRRWRARAIRSLRLTGDETLLDVCTGTADVALAARKSSRSARRVIGIDFAAGMLKHGHRKLRASGQNDAVVLLRGDAMRLPIRSGSIDALTIAFGVRNVADAQVACREMARVLRRGGRLAILEFAVPTLPVVRHAYMSYFTRILPMVGRLVSRHDNAYSYLPASVTMFPGPDRFAHLLSEIGFTDVSVTRLTCGVVCLYSATKAEIPSPSLKSCL